MSTAMKTTVDEIAANTYRLSTFAPDVGPDGFTFNQFLIDAGEPLLFHTGMRGLWPLVSEAISRVRPLEQLRWITFGHVEADESGAVNLALAAAPNSQVAHGALGCDVSVNDMCDRPPRALQDGETIDLDGAHRIRHIDTPHVPHNWESRVLFDESTRTLFCGDLLSQTGDHGVVVEEDLVERAIAAEQVFGASSLSPAIPTTLRRLAELAPTTLAVMHGASFRGDGAAQLRSLADAYEATFPACS
jgi:flavorubredoxin